MRPPKQPSQQSSPRRVRSVIAGTLLMLALQLSATVSVAADRECPNASSALGVERVVEIDTSTGAHFGDHTRRPKEPTFLAPKEVVLTFDDGPMPGLTRQILDTLDSQCTRATWFSVGRMAIAYPDLTREIIRRGHTLGTHTWSHPLNLPRLKHETAVGEIEKGLASVAAAAGQPIAPFFRFPGLNDNHALLAHLQQRGISTFTVDVISDDSYIQSTERLIETTLRRVEARQGGILLFHDIKATTARALPAILSALKRQGYKVVHMVPKAPAQLLAEHVAAVDPLLAKSRSRVDGVAAADASARPAISIQHAAVTPIAPPARSFVVAALEPSRTEALRRPRRKSDRAASREAGAPTSGLSGSWATTYRPAVRPSRRD